MTTGEMATYYAWVEDGADGREGVLAMVLPFMPMPGPSPLMARTLPLAQRLRIFAERHAKETGRAVRLIRFARDEVIEEIAP